MLARTAPDWSLLVRAPADLPCPKGHDTFEGIIETDHWFGRLFITLRLTRTHTPIRLGPDFPLAQIQPLPGHVCGDATLDVTDFFGSIRGFAAQDWVDYQDTIMRPDANPDRPFGAYAMAARKRDRGGCPTGHST